MLLFLLFLIVIFIFFGFVVGRESRARAKLEEELERLQERGWRLNNPVLIPHKLVNKQKNTTNNPFLVFVLTEIAAESVVMVIDQLILFCKDAMMSLFSRPRCVIQTQFENVLGRDEFKKRK